MKDLSKEEMDNLLTTVGDGVLALSNGDVPYCIPFGFVYIEGKIYLSMFPRGRKWEIYQENKKVCFNVFVWNEDHTEWSSVVIDGEMVQLEDLKEIERVVKQRAANVAGAFAVRWGHNFTGKEICLVDDVKTTGATLNECAKTLKEAGASKVFALVLAVAGQTL